MRAERAATPYRRVRPDHTCRYDIEAKALQGAARYEVDEHVLTSRCEVALLDEQHSVDTTPQIWVSGCEDLKSYRAQDRAP